MSIYPASSQGTKFCDARDLNVTCHAHSKRSDWAGEGCFSLSAFYVWGNIGCFCIWKHFSLQQSNNHCLKMRKLQLREVKELTHSHTLSKSEIKLRSVGSKTCPLSAVWQGLIDWVSHSLLKHIFLERLCTYLSLFKELRILYSGEHGRRVHTFWSLPLVRESDSC